MVEFERETGISRFRLNRLFGGWSAARKAAGLPPRGGRTRHVPDREIYQAMHLIVAKLGRFPTLAEWRRDTPFSEGVLQSRGGKKAVQKGDARWVSTKRQLADLKARRDAGEDLTDRERWLLTRSGTALPPDPGAAAAAAGDGDWVRAAFARLAPAFLTHSSDARDGPAEAWGRADYVVVLEHDWPACPKPVFALEQFLPPETGDPAKRAAPFGPLHDPADPAYPLKGKPPRSKADDDAGEP